MLRSKISVGFLIFLIVIISFAVSLTAVLEKVLFPMDDRKEVRRVKRVVGNGAAAGEDVYQYGSEEPEEEECSKGQFWNIRSERCVPLRCPGGNKYRDLRTGECFIGNGQYTGTGYYGKPQLVWRSLSSHRMHKTPFRMGVGRFKG